MMQPGVSSRRACGTITRSSTGFFCMKILLSPVDLYRRKFELDSV